MLSEEERKWFRKNEKEIWEKCITANSPDELTLEIINSYGEQPEGVRRDIRDFMKKAWEKGEDGDWQRDFVAALQLMGIESKIINKKKKK